MNDLSLDLTAQHTLALSPEQRACLLRHDPARPDAGSHRLRIAIAVADGAANLQTALPRYAASKPILGARWLQVSGFRGWRQALPNQGGAVRWVELDTTAPALALRDDEVLAVSRRAHSTATIQSIASALSAPSTKSTSLHLIRG